MKKILFVYGLFLGFMMLYSLREWTFPASSLPIKPQRQSIPSKSFQSWHRFIKSKTPLSSRKYVHLTAAFLWGETLSLSPVMKVPYKKLGLSHVFSPSGFHLQGVYWVMRAFRLHHIFIALALGIFFIPGFSPLKKIILLKNFHQCHLWLCKKGLLQKKISPFVIFHGTFFLFFLSGDYFENPLSFSLSYLFLGIIYALHNEPTQNGFTFFWAFFFGQLLVMAFLPSSVTLTSFFLGFLLGLLFNLIFPVIGLLMSLSYVFSLFPMTKPAVFPVAQWAHMLTKFFHRIVLKMSTLEVGANTPWGALIILILIVMLLRQQILGRSFHNNRKIRMITATLLALFIMSDVNLNGKTKKSRSRKFLPPAQTHFSKSDSDFNSSLQANIK